MEPRSRSALAEPSEVAAAEAFEVERLAGERPVVSDHACQRYAEEGRRQLDARLAREAAGG